MTPCWPRVARLDADVRALLAHLDSASADGLDAAIVTHRHADHVVDLHGLMRARRFGRPESPPLPLYAGPGVVETVEALEVDPGAVRRAFEVHPMPAATYELGPFRMDSWELPHHVPNAGVRLAAPGLTVAYTGDTGASPVLADLARDADLLIADATDWVQFEPASSPSGALNLTAEQAGQVAADAGARRLLLTHFWPGNDREASRAAAAAVFGGDVLLADEDLVVELG